MEIPQRCRTACPFVEVELSGCIPRRNCPGPKALQEGSPIKSAFEVDATTGEITRRSTEAVSEIGHVVCQNAGIDEYLETHAVAQEADL